jgi:hypothetical protein
METSLLENVPTALLCIGIVALTTGVSIAGVLLVRRRVALSTLETHQDVAGYILAVVGVVYAVLLAFVVISVWEQFEDAKGDANTEAATVGLLYRDALILDRGEGRAHVAVRDYARSVAGPEWDEMASEHREHRATDAALDRVWATFRDMRPEGEADTVIYDKAVDRLHEATELRRTRVLNSGNQLPGPLWGVLIAGAVISIGFTYFFGVRSRAAQVLMVAAFSSSVGLVLFLILVLDLPFTGDVGVGPTSMERVIGEFPHYGD